MASQNDPSFDVRTPIIRSETLALSRLVDITAEPGYFGLGVLVPVHFEHEILWQRETETLIEVLNRKGELIQGDLSHTNDWFGLMTSPRDCLSAAVSVCRRFGVSAEAAALDVQVVTSLIERPLIREMRERPVLGKLRARSVPRGWLHRDETQIALWLAATPDQRLADRLEPGTELVARRTDLVVWSSRQGPEASRATIDQLYLRCADGVPAEDKAKLDEVYAVIKAEGERSWDLFRELSQAATAEENPAP